MKLWDRILVFLGLYKGSDPKRALPNLEEIEAQHKMGKELKKRKESTHAEIERKLQELLKKDN